jgi:hypothetical protein
MVEEIDHLLLSFPGLSLASDTTDLLSLPSRRAADPKQNLVDVTETLILAKVPKQPPHTRNNFSQRPTKFPDQAMIWRTSFPSEEKPKLLPTSP